MQDALDREPDNAALHSVYGQFAFMAGRFSEAEQAFLNVGGVEQVLAKAKKLQES
mgnify:CR=1 FL=1